MVSEILINQIYRFGWDQRRGLTRILHPVVRRKYPLSKVDFVCNGVTGMILIHSLILQSRFI
jgi:hypothetical protein